MDPRVGHVLALLLGITLTVGFYEGRRLVNNTLKAVSAANAELRGSGGGGSARKSDAKKARKKADAKKARKKAEDGVASAEGFRGGGTKKSAKKSKGRSKKEVLRERLRAKLTEMSPAEQEALKERVRDRRDARKADALARREIQRERRQQRMAELGLSRDDALPPEEGFDEDFGDGFDDADFDPDAPVAEDELLDALEEDLPLEDTAFPVE